MAKGTIDIRKSKVVLYSRPSCHLCDVALDVLERARRKIPFDLVKIDVSGQDELERAYGHDLPVVTVDGLVAFKHEVDEAALTARLTIRSGAR